MNRTLQFIADKFGVDLNARCPIALPISRHGLAKLFADLGFKHIVEIGVEKGLYTKALAKFNPQATIYAIDAWHPIKGYRDHVNRDKLQRFYEISKERLAPFPNVKIIRQLSLDAVRDFNDKSLDAVYIDADHCFQSVTNDICEWGKKVKAGGIVAGHDFAHLNKGNALMHVKYVVEGYTRCYDIYPWFLTNTDEEEPEADSLKTNRSFLWVKQ